MFDTCDFCEQETYVTLTAGVYSCASCAEFEIDSDLDESELN